MVQGLGSYCSGFRLYGTGFGELVREPVVMIEEISDAELMWRTLESPV